MQVSEGSLKRKIPFELSSLQLTENGFTPAFEAEVLAEANKDYTAIANGTARRYKNAAELRAELDAEDDEEDYEEDYEEDE